MAYDTSLVFQDGALSSITREALADLPIRRYEGEVILVDSPAHIDAAESDFAQETLVGLDTETRPSFRKGESHLPCLVQVATARAVYLFKPGRADAQPLLRALLEDARVIKAGVALAYDLRALQDVFAFESRKVVDLGALARRRGCTQTGLRNLAGMFLDFRIPKGTRTSNWAAARLSPQQVSYAATDAWACRELYLRFETLGVTDE